MSVPLPETVEAVAALLQRHDYLADKALATALFLALKLNRPLFLEGEAGVGKTDLARATAIALERPLIRLQCYEGLDAAASLYEWNYAAQMLEIRLHEVSKDADQNRLHHDLFSERFLIARPLLQALQAGRDGMPAVLLIDEIDRADASFEAFLLELLADYQITIPELGTIKAIIPPLVFLTSNRTREIHDALKRRCLYHWIDYPDLDRECDIVAMRTPGIATQLTRDVVGFVQALRGEDLFKRPGLAETLDWIQALIWLDATVLETDMINVTLGAVLKYQDDLERIRGSEAARLLDKVRSQYAEASIKIS